MNTGFRNSDGWNCAMPPPIHRRAPFTSTPTNGVASSSSPKNAHAPSANRRASAVGSIEKTSMTGTDSATHTA